MVVKRRFRGIVLPVMLYLISGTAAAFFVREAQNGNRGIENKNALIASIERLNTDLANLKAERVEWERKNAMLSLASLDLDLLEERARLVLNRGHKNDVVIMTPQ